jgi:hypothetical protein
LIGHELRAGDETRLIPGGVDRRAGDVPPQPDAERPATRRWWSFKKASVP